jgi:hypothetical protein
MDNTDYNKNFLNIPDKSDVGKKNINFDVDEFYRLLDNNKMKTKKILSNVNYNLNEENNQFFKYYYTLIFLLENKFENYDELKKSLMIESIELEVINKIIEVGSNLEEIKKTINSYLSTRSNYLRKKFDMCTSVVDIKEKQKRYIDSIHYINDIFENPNIINDLESSVNYGRK